MTTKTAPSSHRPQGAAKKATETAGFPRFFEVVRANTPDLLKKVYRLRYQVYCVENDFEDPAENPEGLESDEYDSHSVHSLVIHRDTGAPVGAVRLILPRSDAPHQSLPIQKICGHTVLRDMMESSGTSMAELSRFASSVAELSRFAVSRDFRRRAGEGRFADVGARGIRDPQTNSDRRSLPHITLTMMKAVLEMSVENNITHICAIMEPALIRLIGRFGLHFKPIGPLVDYHGQRQPCYSDIDSLVECAKAYRRDYWEFGTEGGQVWPSRR